MYVYIYIYMYVCIYVCVCVRARVCAYIYFDVCARAYSPIHGKDLQVWCDCCLGGGMVGKVPLWDVGLSSQV